MQKLGRHFLCLRGSETTGDKEAYKLVTRAQADKHKNRLVTKTSLIH